MQVFYKKLVVILEEYKRKKCPLCGNENPKKIREIDDLSKPLYHFGFGAKPMYAKKYVCTMCKYEW